MQNFQIETPVKGDYRAVMERFDRELLEQLTPPGIQLNLLRYDGSQLNDQVHIQLRILGLLRQEWESVITEVGEDEQAIWFVDEGRKLPSFLKYWKHRHLVRRRGTDSTIVDDITYETPFAPMDYVMFPVIYGQFAYRKPIYQRFFGT